jgi:iron complex outermembrane receptor protein
MIYVYRILGALFLCGTSALLPQANAQSAAQSTAQSNSIVVTGTFDPVALDELDRAVSTLPVRQEEILLNSWVDALREEPSVDLQERAPGGEQTDVSIRGATFGQTLVLLNGIRLNDVQSGHHNMDLPVPLDNIDHLEVLRGSGSALYGSDAVGGVINVITKAPESSEFVLRTAVGSFGTNEQSGSVALAWQKAVEQVTFSRAFSDGFQFDRDYRSLSFGSETLFRSSLGATDILAAYADKPFGANQFYGDYPSWEDTKTWFAAIKQDFGPDTQALFAFRRHSDLFVLFRDQPEIYTNHHSDESFEAALRRTQPFNDAVRLFYGVEFEHESVVSTNLGNHARTRGSVYAALDIRPWKRFSLSLGGREDVYDQTSGQFNPTVAAGYWLTSRLRLRASVSRAFRLPTYTDLYYHDPADLGNALLKPEHAWSYEGGVEFQIAPGWRAEATVFQRRDYNGIDYVRASLNDIWQATNFDRLRFTGFEGALVTRLTKTQSLDLRFTGIHGVSDSLAGLYSKYAFNFPQESGVAEYRASFGQLLLRSRFGAEKRIMRSPYAVWDVYAAWSRWRVKPFVQLTNITNADYQEIFGIALPGRAILGGVEIRAWR